MIVVSHALDHVIEVADRAVVMRRGRKVGEVVPTAETHSRSSRSSWEVVAERGDATCAAHAGVARHCRAERRRAPRRDVASRGTMPRTVDPKGRTRCRRRRLAAATVLVPRWRAPLQSRRSPRARKPARTQETSVKLGLHHEVPRRLLLHAGRRGEGWDRSARTRSSTRRARAAPTTRARSRRSSTWSPRASRASRSPRRARRHPGAGQGGRGRASRWS